MNNNPDLINSNTLDLHGLHSKEALTAFKQLLKQRKEGNHKQFIFMFHFHRVNRLLFVLKELIKNGNRKQKTYIFVITGCGNHSSSKPVIRPTIINYLNQKHISYKEPRLGLLKVQLI
jgi:DNA-nicking Smr family endonuclease